MITVIIQGHGTFTIPSDKINELIAWLQSNSGMSMENSSVPDGKTLLNG